jgi:hypothetical protein
MSDLVWYASYGSNLLRERFLAYILGAHAPGAATAQVGCTDPTLPRAERRLLLLHKLYFAHTSSQWEDQGVAFIHREQEESAKTLGRMYLISSQQFKEVFLQENGYADFGAEVDLDLEAARRDGRKKVDEGLYGTLLNLGEEGGHPIFTFTASWNEDQAPLHRPGPNYLKVIVRGLQESYPISKEGAVEYLSAAPGVEGAISDEELKQIVAGAGA